MEHISELVKESKASLFHSDEPEIPSSKARLRLIEAMSAETFPLNFSGDTLPVAEDLMAYFRNDPAFRGNLSKGILLYGPPGRGKSTLMRIFMNARLRPFRHVSCPDMALRMFNGDMDDFLRFGIGAHAQPASVLFDDLGAEIDVNHYGSKISPMEQILQTRYGLSEKGLAKTHFTTNLNPEQLAQRYGEKGLSRLQGMCNIIPYGQNSPDFRGQNPYPSKP
ncbi:hypothetical protein FUAX_53930 (plasmid) [Fulvitalea axinellae]|uniref:ATPase AAA-type core domain-containing protein n=1 Tax=Fulvitalea axinellae TaxID=1182444 RepID=A0AAU9CV80_9BACT|nr:hypothetical protein FUAX_53930 [Fulvitalea axinellae]